MTARVTDLNGFVEIKGNPISKVGVFPYLGAQISDELIADKIYNVYRPEDELRNQETLDSFKLVPFTDEHAMLGAEDQGLLPAEKKGVHGVIGEEVFFEDGYLKANLKIFSEKLAKLIQDGKKELSIGYRCMYDIATGLYKGQSYDAVQRNIRGNHIALVEEGRAGPDVAVLDHFTFALDTGGLRMEPVEKEKAKEEVKDEGLTLESLAEKIEALEQALMKMAETEGQQDEDPLVKEGEVMADEEVKKEEKKDGMDAKIKHLEAQVAKMNSFDSKAFLQEISRRNELANDLSKHIGTFDHANQTFEEVTKYGVKKLGLSCSEGQEEATLRGFLAGRKLNFSVSTAVDSKPNSGQIDAYLKGEK